MRFAIPVDFTGVSQEDLNHIIEEVVQEHTDEHNEIHTSLTDLVQEIVERINGVAGYESGR